MQTVAGRLEGAMNRDEAYHFIDLGRQLERADMTTRLIDSSSARLVPREGDDGARFDDLQWMSVLKSLTGYQMYRLEMQRAIRSESVLRFLRSRRASLDPWRARFSPFAGASKLLIRTPPCLGACPRFCVR